MSDNESDRSRDRGLKRDRQSRFSDHSRDRSPDRKDRAGGKTTCRVYVSNIPYEYRWQDLKDLFRNQVGDVAFVELFVDSNDKPRGCGIVEFSDIASVKKCLEVMHRFELKGRKLVIKEDYGNQRDKYGNLVGSLASKRVREREESRERRYREESRGRGGGGGGGGFDNRNNNRSAFDDSKCNNTYGLSPQFLESLGINLPLINRVFVANLDYQVDKRKLKEVFRLAGKVQHVDLSVDRDGKSRGFAIIEYDHPVEAVQAISMFQNQFLFDRMMTVRMDRENSTVKLPDGLKGMGMGLGVNGEPLRDVARNLPSISGVASQQNSTSGAGAGILGAVPNVQLGGLGNALNTLNSVNPSALSNAAVLQAANLAGVGGLSAGNLLANSLGGGDLSLAAASLVNNPLVQNQSLAALANSNNLSASNLGNSNFSSSRNDNNYLGGNNSGQSNSGGYQSSVLSQNQGYLGGNRNSSSGYDDQKNSGFNFNSGDRDNRNTGGNIYSTVSNGSQLLRSAASNLGGNKGAQYSSNKILITNLPPTASYKMLSEKCNEFGDVQRVEDKGNNGVLVVFASDWEAERAIKNMDRARIDGRTIDVRFF